MQGRWGLDCHYGPVQRYLPLISYKRHRSLLQSPLKTYTVRNEGHYFLSQCNMNSLLADNVKCGNIKVKKMMEVMSMISDDDKSMYRHNDVGNYVIISYNKLIIIVTGLDVAVVHNVERLG